MQGAGGSFPVSTTNARIAAGILDKMPKRAAGYAAARFDGCAFAKDLPADSKAPPASNTGGASHTIPTRGYYSPSGSSGLEASEEVEGSEGTELSAPPLSPEDGLSSGSEGSGSGSGSGSGVLSGWVVQ